MNLKLLLKNQRFSFSFLGGGGFRFCLFCRLVFRFFYCKHEGLGSQKWWTKDSDPKPKTDHGWKEHMKPESDHTSHGGKARELRPWGDVTTPHYNSQNYAKLKIASMPNTGEAERKGGHSYVAV